MWASYLVYPLLLRGRVVAAVGGRGADTIRLGDVMIDAAAVNEEVAEEEGRLHVVVGKGAAVGGDLVAVTGVNDSVRVYSICGD